jgi:HSP20 family protein
MEGVIDMNALMPVSPMLTSFRKEMDRLFERAFDQDFEIPNLGAWMPPIDLSENNDTVFVRLEVPGIDPKDIQVQLKGNVLTVRGEKIRETEKKDESYFRAERSYGSFVRTLQLPASVREDKVNATFKNGLLTITLSKVPEAVGTTIPIKTL